MKSHSLDGRQVRFKQAIHFSWNETRKESSRVILLCTPMFVQGIAFVTLFELLVNVTSHSIRKISI